MLSSIKIIDIHLWGKTDHVNAIFRTSQRVTHVVHAGDVDDPWYRKCVLTHMCASKHRVHF